VKKGISIEKQEIKGKKWNKSFCKNIDFWFFTECLE